MSLLPSLLAVLVILIYGAASSRTTQDAGLQSSQHADQLLAFQRAEAELARAARGLGSDGNSSNGGNGGNGRNDDIHGNDGHDGRSATLELLPSAADAELEELPLLLHRLTVTSEAGSARIRLQADYAVDGCESAHDDDCVPRVRRIAWRQLPTD